MEKVKPLNECIRQFTEDEILQYWRLPAELFKDSKPFIATASGNGMTDFGIEDNDMLIFDSSAQAEIGDIIMSGGNAGKMVRQILFDAETGKYCLHASGIDHREDITTDDPVVYGVLAFVMKRFDVRKSDVNRY